MNRIKFSYAQSCLVSGDEIVAASNKLVPEMQQISALLGDGYQSEYTALHLPFDDALRETVHALAQEKKALKPSVLVVVGIGGSNLGTKAVHEALLGTRYNEQDPPIKVYYADTIDTDYMLDLILLVEQELEKGHEVLINVVSKSGTTPETIVNFELLLYMLQKSRKADFHKYVVVTTDEDSKLWKFAQEKKFACLAVPQKVGGRFSVFSPVGLFPLEMIGVDTRVLCKGAQSMVPSFTHTDVYHNPAALRAIILAYWHEKQVRIHDMFLFSVDLASIGLWYRQLLAESIGKAADRQGNKIAAGITPTVSVGTTDLHSVAQLYLAGPRSSFTTFVSTQKHKSNLTLPELKEFDALVPHLQGKELAKIMDAVLRGVMRAYQKGQRPFNSIELPEKSAYHVGQLLQMYMFEIIYLAQLLNVNPFDQPQVELYKKETKEILAHE